VTSWPPVGATLGTRAGIRVTFAFEWVIDVLVQLTMAAWLALEAGLLIRDRVRGKGGTARDRGTLLLNIIIITAAVVVAGIVTGALKNASAWQFGSPALSAAGLIVMWTGLAIRIWAIVVLGRSFRTTVEVDTDQKVIERGPYRWVRHPSYTGILLVMVGLGLGYGNWPALAILLVLPACVLINRIVVEEAVLTEVLGRAYLDYAAGTKRLVPGLW
jgi:protein-S-isoprenylcysteine O-methyltransferase Ste14